MSYDQSPKTASSLGGLVFFLLIVMVGLTAAAFSTGIAGTSERGVQVVVPVVITGTDQK